MTAADLDALARTLGREPSSLPWCTGRRLLERIVADDVEGVRSLYGDSRESERSSVERPPVPSPSLTTALGVAAWKVAAELIDRGEPLEAPPRTVWDAGAYAIAALDDSDEAALVLERLLARRRLKPSGGLLRHVRSPRIAHALIDAGARPNDLKPSIDEPLDGSLQGSTPLAVAVVLQRLDVAGVLLERGANLEARDAHGRTALIQAVRWGNEAPVRWLLDRGAVLKSAADAQGRTPESLARARPDDPSSRVLLEALEKGHRS